MSEHPEPDTRVEFFEVGTIFYFLGEWHTVAKQQPYHLPGQRYVTTEGERTFLMNEKMLVATEPKAESDE